MGQDSGCSLTKWFWLGSLTWLQSKRYPGWSVQGLTGVGSAHLSGCRQAAEDLFPSSLLRSLHKATSPHDSGFPRVRENTYNRSHGLFIISSQKWHAMTSAVFCFLEVNQMSCLHSREGDGYWGMNTRRWGSLGAERLPATGGVQTAFGWWSGVGVDLISGFVILSYI